MIKAYIFDLGNTLMYFDGDWDVVTREGLALLVDHLRSSGLHVGDGFGESFIQIRKAGRERSVRTDVEFTAADALREAIAREGYNEVSDARVSRSLELFFRPEEEHWVSYPDVRETLQRLQDGGMRVGLLSNATDQAFINRITERAGISQFLDPIVTSASLPWRKPDVRTFLHVLDYWNIAPGDAVMVGDWPSMDVLGAHRAGMKAVLIEGRWPQPPAPHGLFPDAALMEPDAAISELRELFVAAGRFNQ